MAAELKLVFENIAYKSSLNGLPRDDDCECESIRSRAQPIRHQYYYLSAAPVDI